MTRRKIDGGRVPTEAIDECLAIAGVAKKDIEALVLGRAAFPARFHSHMPFDRAIEAKLRRLVGKEKHKSMERECGAAADDSPRLDPLYYDILKAFERRTGLPILINTSFNGHEEPIINRPEDCLRALADRRIDYVVTGAGSMRASGPTAGSLLAAEIVTAGPAAPRFGAPRPPTLRFVYRNHLRMNRIGYRASFACREGLGKRGVVH